jgi:hypothetical protein
MSAIAAAGMTTLGPWSPPMASSAMVTGEPILNAVQEKLPMQRDGRGNPRK